MKMTENWTGMYDLSERYSSRWVYSCRHQWNRYLKWWFLKQALRFILS